MIKLGIRVKDSITGYEGVAIARTDWLYGCVRITIQGDLDKDGQVPDNVTFDEDQLTAIPNAVKKANEKKKKDEPAGDRSTPTRHANPQR